MIFNRNRDLLEIFSNFAKFFKHESCGLCTPCRAGNYIIQRKLHTLQQGLGLQKDLDDLKNWGGIMKIASRCGLGKAATNSVTMALEKFPQYFDTRITSNQTGNNESFRLDKAVEAYEKFKG